ncbi:MAG: DUF4058 family protein [Gemmataceae bacterium]|nr:DUF4058 family protein [Gemmataceae bacterium]
MPLHDWNDSAGWQGFHHCWITEILRWLQPRLPAPYRAYLGTTPTVTMEALAGNPDVSVRQWSPPVPAVPSLADAPDFEGEATMTLDPPMAVHVRAHGRLVAAIELISPGNKDDFEARAYYTRRYLGYLADGANLVLVDVHRRPSTFSFADTLAAEVGLAQPPFPSPHALAYRVGAPLADRRHRFVAVWRRPLAAGAALPSLPLPLTADQSIPMDLETTYREAARLVYMD